MTEAPRFRIETVALYERPVRLRIPFRFGVVTLTEAPQAFARVCIALPDGRRGEGWAAELMVPKWFDKDPALSNADNIDQLRHAAGAAARSYADGRLRTAFGHFAAHHRPLMEAAAALGLNPLAAGFGPALLDKAVLDAAGRALGVSFQEMMRRNLAGVRSDPALTPDIEEGALAAFLNGLAPGDGIAVRHTVGLADPIVTGDLGPEAPVDGLPRSLEEVVATYGHRHFKLKIAGDPALDLDRLARIAAVLDRDPAPYLATLDGNEQYLEVEGILELWHRLGEAPRLARLRSSIAFVEQPIVRHRSVEVPIAPLAAEVPVIIDEADATLDAFPRARALGYAGVSSKACKGLYKSILNAARCTLWNAGAGTARYFLAAEDLTTQAGLAVQQDLALVSLLGIAHVERNGHHYVDGFGAAPDGEAEAFLAAHPGLYHRRDGRVRLAIRDGRLALASLACPGFAGGAAPDLAALTEMPLPAAPPTARGHRRRPDVDAAESKR